MSKWYKKGKGRKSALENAQVKDIEILIEEHGIDILEYDSPTTPQELSDLRTNLINKYGTPPIKKDVFPSDVKKSEPTIEQTQEPAPEAESGETFEEPELTEPIAETSSPSTKTWDLSDFKPKETTSPFEASFPEQDMFKAVDSFPQIEPEPTPEPSATPTEPTDSTPNAWEVLKNRNEKLGALERIDDPDSEESKGTSNTDGEKKVAMSSEARKKSSEAFARQTAKIFTWLSESGVKYFSKVKDKHITELEQEGLIDRNYQVGGKTVAELLDQHHELIDEMVKVDPQSKNDLIEAIKLVAQEHEIEMSPMANLGMVIVTILLTMGQAGIQTKREFKRHLKVVSDQYVINKRQIAPMEDEIRQLKSKLSQQENGSVSAQPSSFSAPVEIETPAPAKPPIKELSFKPKDKSGLNIQRSTPQEIEEEISGIEEIGSEVDEGTVTVKKNGKKAVKRVKKKTAKQ